MERDNVLQNIADAINAAVKIRNLQSSAVRGESNLSSGQNKTYVFGETLKTLADFSRDHYKNTIKNAVEISNLYSDTYNKLRQHIRTSRAGKIGATEIIRTLEIMKPMLPDQHKTVIDKVQKIYHIINS